MAPDRDWPTTWTGPAKRLANQFDDRGRQLAEIREGAFLDLAVFPIGLAKQDSGGRVAIGDGIDVHGHMYTTYVPFMR